MLSKMTFSLVFVLILALVATPVFAQTMIVSNDINDGAGAATELEKNSFVVLQRPSPANGIIAAPVTLVTSIPNQFPNIADILAFGGTIELLLREGTGLTAGSLHRLAITEIMWGTDSGGTDDAAQRAT